MGLVVQGRRQTMASDFGYTMEFAESTFRQLESFGRSEGQGHQRERSAHRYPQSKSFLGRGQQAHYISLIERLDD